MAGYIGGKVAISSPQQIETKHTVTATASQTSITNVGYTVGAVHVYQNGIRLVDGTDYTATNGSTVTLETGATENDQIVIVSHGSFETADTVSKASGGTFSGNVTVSGNITATGSVTGNSLVVPDGSIPLVDLDIDGGTDIGAALVDADLMVVDDGAGGTNRKATMSRLATYMGTKIGGGMEFLSSTGAISNAANVSFTQFDSSKYDRYIIYFYNVIPATDNTALKMLTSTDGGSNYDTTSGNYETYNQTDAANILLYTSGIGSESNEFGVTGHVEILNPANENTWTHFMSDLIAFRQTGPAQRDSSFFTRTVTDDVDAVQISFTSGNIESGEITMFGIVNS